MKKLLHVLENSMSHKHIKVCLYCLSNITAGTQDNILLFANTVGLLNRVIFFIDSNDIDIKREAFYVICNLIYICENESIIDHVAKYQNCVVLQKMVQMIDNQTLVPLMVEILDSLYELLAHDLKVQNSSTISIRYLFESLNGIDKLYELQTHQNQVVIDKSNNII